MPESITNPLRYRIPGTKRRVDIKAVIHNESLWLIIKERATDFICRVEGIRTCRSDSAELKGGQAEPPRRHIFPTPHQIAECGGPCKQGGPEACDCGLYERNASKSTH